MKFIYFFFLIFFVAFFQIAFPLSYIIRLDLLFLVTLYAVLYLPIEQALILAFIGGFILDAFSPVTLGSYTFTRVLLAYLFGVYFKLLLIKRPLMAGVGVAIGCFIESIILWLIADYSTNFLFYLFLRALPQAILMGLISIPLLWATGVQVSLSK